MELKTEQIAGFDVTIDVTPTGQFRVMRGEGMIATAMEMSAAIEAAKRKLSKERIRVEVAYFTEHGDPGVATGIHAGHGGVLVRESGESTTRSGYSAKQVFRADMPEPVRQRLRKIQDEQYALKEETSRIREEWMFDLSAAVEEALDQARQEVS